MTAATILQSSPTGPVIKADDRLGLTLFFAVVLHSLIILGVSFSQPEKKDPPEKLPGLEITLVQTKSDKDIEDADFLAQVNQEGSGRSEDADRPTNEVVPIIPTGEMGDVQEIVSEMVMPQASDPQQMQLLTVNQADIKMLSQDNKQDIDSPQQELTMAQIVSLSTKLAQQSAEINQLRKKYARMPTTLFPDAARTKAYKPAVYEEKFREKIERIGTLNFPDEAKRKHLSGNVRVMVIIAANGNVKEIKVNEYSGHKILDDAAVRIVRMASPFEPLPDELREQYGQWIIVRTFQFLAGKQRVRAQR